MFVKYRADGGSKSCKTNTSAPTSRGADPDVGVRPTANNKSQLQLR